MVIGARRVGQEVLKRKRRLSQDDTLRERRSRAVQVSKKRNLKGRLGGLCRRSQSYKEVRAWIRSVMESGSGY